MQTFLPYKSFEKSAKCLDYKRLGKQRIETWQIYSALKQGEYKECPECKGKGWQGFASNATIFLKCKKCKSTGKIKTAWYNHPITQMWKGYENCLLIYGYLICQEWRNRGYKDTMIYKFYKEIIKKELSCSIIETPKWLGNRKFHSSHRSNLLRKDKKYYSQFSWKEPDNLPYYWIKNEN
jgi:hypothetical protein